MTKNWKVSKLKSIYNVRNYPIIQVINTRWFANNVSFTLIGGSFKDKALEVNYYHTPFKLVIKTFMLPLHTNITSL